MKYVPRKSLIPPLIQIYGKSCACFPISTALSVDIETLDKYSLSIKQNAKACSQGSPGSHSEVDLVAVDKRILEDSNCLMTKPQGTGMSLVKVCRFLEYMSFRYFIPFLSAPFRLRPKRFSASHCSYTLQALAGVPSKVDAVKICCKDISGPRHPRPLHALGYVCGAAKVLNAHVTAQSVNKTRSHRRRRQYGICSPEAARVG